MTKSDAYEVMPNGAIKIGKREYRLVAQDLMPIKEAEVKAAINLLISAPEMLEALKFKEAFVKATASKEALETSPALVYLGKQLVICELAIQKAEGRS